MPRISWQWNTVLYRITLTNQNWIHEDQEQITYGEFSLPFILPVGYLNTLSIKIYRNTHIILPGILYGCDTSYLTLREEQQVEALWKHNAEEDVGPNREEVTEEWWKLHNKQLHYLYCSPNTFY